MSQPVPRDQPVLQAEIHQEMAWVPRSTSAWAVGVRGAFPRQKGMILADGLGGG